VSSARFHTLALDVSTETWMSPPASVVRFEMHDRAKRCRGCQLQSGTGVGEPLASVRSILERGGRLAAAADESSVNVITRGWLGSVVGAEISICRPTIVKPGGPARSRCLARCSRHARRSGGHGDR